MSNDHLMYYSDWEKCNIKVEFDGKFQFIKVSFSKVQMQPQDSVMSEDWESKFTPGGW